MKKISILITLFLILLFSGQQAYAIDNKITSLDSLYWAPVNPEEGDTITVYAEITGNVTNINFQYCPNSTGSCFYPSMEKVGDRWQVDIPSHHIVEGDTIEIKVNVTTDSGIFTDTKLITIQEKENNGAPGFELSLILAAIALMVSIKTRKRI